MLLWSLLTSIIMIRILNQASLNFETNSLKDIKFFQHLIKIDNFKTFSEKLLSKDCLHTNLTNVTNDSALKIFLEKKKIRNLQESRWFEWVQKIQEKKSSKIAPHEAKQNTTPMCNKLAMSIYPYQGELIKQNTKIIANVMTDFLRSSCPSAI